MKMRISFSIIFTSLVFLLFSCANAIAPNSPTDDGGIPHGINSDNPLAPFAGSYSSSDGSYNFNDDGTGTMGGANLSARSAGGGTPFTWEITGKDANNSNITYGMLYVGNAGSGITFNTGGEAIIVLINDKEYIKGGMPSGGQQDDDNAEPDGSTGDDDEPYDGTDDGNDDSGDSSDDSSSGGQQGGNDTPSGGGQQGSGNDTPSGTTPEDEIIETSYKNSAQWYLPALQMSDAWKILNKYKRTKIRVAVIDTDIRITHQEFEGIINKELSWDVGKNSRLTDAGRVATNTGHGTGVISVLAAVGKKMQGVAQGSIEIIPVAIDNDIETGIYDKLKSSIQAFKYIENLLKNNKVKNLKVISLSSSYIETDIKNSAGSADYKATIEELKNVIERLRSNYGVLTVAAGGNVVYGETRPDDFVVPSDFSSVIGVTATDKVGNHQQGFCYNEHKDLSAPGVDVFVATNNSDTSYYEKLANINEYPTGTSYSAPIVSGIAAMMWSLNPGMTVNEVISILKTTATTLPRNFTNRSNGVDYNAINGSSGLVNPVAAITSVAAKYGTLKPQ